MLPITITVPPQASRFAELTFPMFRPLLSESSGAEGVVAAAADAEDGSPAGLALARLSGEAATVLSVSVVPAHRRRGLATALLEALEQELGRRACRRVDATFMTGLPSTPALEALLRRRAWSAPVPRMVVCRSDIETLARAPWVRAAPVPTRWEVVPWSALAESERRSVRDTRGAASPPEALSPLRDEDRIASNSVGLRVEGRVVGWMLAHHAAPGVIRYGPLFLAPGHRARGQGLLLTGLCIRRHYESALRFQSPRCSCDYEAGNRVMSNFTAKRLLPYLLSVAVTKGSEKGLDARPARAPHAAA